MGRGGTPPFPLCERRCCRSWPLPRHAVCRAAPEAPSPTQRGAECAAGCGRPNNSHPSLAKGDVRFRDNGLTFKTSSSSPTSGTSTNIRDINGVLKTFASWEADPGWFLHTFVSDYLEILYNTDSYLACVSIRQIGGDPPPRTRRRQASGVPF